MNSSTDRVVVVTGAASGIGAAIATWFAERGARVAAVDVSPGMALSPRRHRDVTAMSP